MFRHINLLVIFHMQAVTAHTSSSWSCDSKNIWGFKSCSRIESKKSAEDFRKQLELRVSFTGDYSLEVFNIWTTKMVQSVSCLPHKHEDGNLESQYLCGRKKQDVSSHACRFSSGEVEMEDSWSSLVSWPRGIYEL